MTKDNGCSCSRGGSAQFCECNAVTLGIESGPLLQWTACQNEADQAAMLARMAEHGVPARAATRTQEQIDRMGMDAVMTARARLVSLTAWVAQHGNACDATVFAAECDKILSHACAEARMIRTPRAAFGRGALTLDIACAIMGVELPGTLLWADEDVDGNYDQRPFPGVREYVAACETMW